jgi:hypothetical protein
VGDRFAYRYSNDPGQIRGTTAVQRINDAILAIQVTVPAAGFVMLDRR